MFQLPTSEEELIHLALSFTDSDTLLKLVMVNCSSDGRKIRSSEACVIIESWILKNSTWLRKHINKKIGLGHSIVRIEIMGMSYTYTTQSRNFDRLSELCSPYSIDD